MKKKCCLSFGKCKKKFWLLILVAFIIDVVLFIFVSYFSMNILYFDSIKMMPFLLFENLCQSFMIIPHLIFKKMNASKARDSTDSSSSEKLQRFPTNFIFNKSEITFSFSEKIYFAFFIFLKLFTEIFYITYLLFVEKNKRFNDELAFSFQFELIFLFLISKLFYNIEYYKHQYISIIILTIFELINFYITFTGESTGDFFLYLHCHIIYSFLKSTVTVYMKGLMEKKYMSPYKVCFLFGVFNLIIVSLVYFIASFYSCDGYLCLEEYNGKYYFGNFVSILNINIFILLLFFTLKSIVLILNYVIINEFSVCHSFLLIKISQMLENSIHILIFGFGDDASSNIIIASIFIFFGFYIFFIFLFLEIIEINSCNINYNTKKNIASRANSDFDMEDLNLDNNTEDNLNDYNSQ